MFVKHKPLPPDEIFFLKQNVNDSQKIIISVVGCSYNDVCCRQVTIRVI